MQRDGEQASELKLARPPVSPAASHTPRSGLGLLPTGVEIPCDLREIAHPEGRFRREDGSRYDICVMEVRFIPNLRAPAMSREHFSGDCADNQPAVIRLGNVRQSSFRLRLISPGAALGTLAAAAKSSASVVV